MFQYLSFTDAAKFADIARNIVNGNGFYSNFNFFDPNKINSTGLFEATFTPPAIPYAIALFFNLFGVSDSTVIFTSFFFYILTLVFTFLLSNRLFGKLTAVLATLAVATNINIWDYATSGASETLFMFQIVAIPYVILIRKNWSNFIALLLLILNYFTRPQAFIFIAVYILFYLLLKFKLKQAFMYWLGILFAGLIVDKLILAPLNGKFFLYSITGRGAHAITQHSSDIAVSDVLRGVEKQSSTMFTTLKKVLLNLFNFYRSIPQIMNPYLITLFAVSPLTIFKKREVRSFVIITFLATFLSFLLPAMTIPFYRYIHPVLPLIYIVGIASLVAILRKFIRRKQYVIASSSAFILFLVVGLSVSTYLHDLRFNNARSNLEKVPIYVSFSDYLKNNTSENDLIITNLDTWGSWYGERKTIWYPLEPSMLEPVLENIDAIYLTNYKMDDENYYMGEEWREIFNNPTSHNNKFINENFEFAEEFTIPASETYENQAGRAVLFVRK